MNDRNPPRINKIPFYIADLLLLAAAIWVAQRSPAPLELRTALLCSGLAIIAAVFFVLPFMSEYKAAVKTAESNNLARTVEQIKNLETVAQQIAAATARWQDVQNAAGQTATAAKEISDHMDEELKGFAEFMQKASDSEKGALRLEVEKLRRAEGDWLQITVRILDHVFALYQAGLRSGNAELSAQLGQFQHACRDTARRIGLIPFAAEVNEPFDEKRHKTLEHEPAQAGDPISETLAPGFTFQGQLLRPALVKLQAAAQPQQAEPEPTSSETTVETSTENPGEQTLL